MCAGWLCWVAYWDNIYLSGGAVSPDGKVNMQVADMTQKTAVEYILFTVGHESGNARDIVHFMNRKDMENYIHTVLVPLHLEDDGFSPDDIQQMYTTKTFYGDYDVLVKIDGQTWSQCFKVTRTERLIRYE
jgi:hypothetical protein